MEDRIRPHVLPKLDLPQQPPNFATLHPLGSKLLPPQFLDRLRRVGLAWPFSTSQPKNRRSVTRARLMVATACPCSRRRPVLEVGHVPGRHPADAEWLGIGLGEPRGKLPQVLSDGPAGVGREVLVAKVAARPGRPRPARQRCGRKHYHPNSSRLILHELDINSDTSSP